MDPTRDRQLRGVRGVARSESELVNCGGKMVGEHGVHCTRRYPKENLQRVV